MLKKVLLLSSVLVMALSLCACSDDGDLDITFKRKDSASTLADVDNQSLTESTEAETTEPEETTQAPTEAEGTMYAATQEVNVRSQPSFDADVEILGQLAYDQQVSVKGITDGWAEISYNGQTAYVSAEYLTLVS